MTGIPKSRVNRIQTRAREVGKLTTPPPKSGRKSRSDPPAEYDA
jgi:hypothetical protein